MATTMASRHAIPGPRSLLLLSWRGGMLKLYQRPFSFLRDLHATYGDVVTLAQGTSTYVCAFGPDLNFQVLSNPQLFQAGGDVSVTKFRQDTAFGKLMSQNLMQMDGEKHRQHRRLMQPAFHRQQIAAYHQDMMSLTQQLLESWREQTQINVHREMQDLTLRIAVKTLFGVYDEEELQRVGTLLRDMTRSMLLTMALPYDIPGTPYHRVLRLSEELTAFMRATIARKRAHNEEADVLSALIHAHDEEGATLSDDELIGHAFALFVAGHETTANALSWTLLLLSQHPQVCAELLEELDGALQGSVPTLEQLSQLSLLDGVIKESLRLFPPAAIGIRIASEACDLGGYALPKGTNVVYSEFLTHRLPELYTNPDHFLPKRWASLTRSPYEYLPFSAGRHMCIGLSFATQEMKVVLAMLLQRYRLEPVPNAKISTQLSMRPVPGIPMHVFPQDRSFKRVPVRGTIHQLVELPKA